MSTSCSGCGGTAGIAPSSTKFFGGMRESLSGVAFYGIDGSLVWSTWAAGTDLSGVPYRSCGTGVMYGAHGGWGSGMDEQTLYCRNLCENCGPGTSSSMSAYGTSSAACVACVVGKMSATNTAVTSTVPVLRDVTRTCQQGPCFASLYPNTWGNSQGTTVNVDLGYGANRALDGNVATQTHSISNTGSWLQIDLEADDAKSEYASVAGSITSLAVQAATKRIADAAAEGQKSQKKVSKAAAKAAAAHKKG